jgi:hypothetical protein
MCISAPKLGVIEIEDLRVGTVGHEQRDHGQNQAGSTQMHQQRMKSPAWPRNLIPAMACAFTYHDVFPPFCGEPDSL